MRAYVVESHGDPEVLRLEERPLPQPAPGQVRLRVRAVALNHLDLWLRAGVPGHKFPLPLIPGSDMAGRVTAVGPGVDPGLLGGEFLVMPGYGCGHCPACHRGQEQLCRSYVIVGESCDGGCAEEALIPQRNLLPHPPHLSLAEGVSMPLSLLTAWHMLVARARIRPAERVLIHAGGSGVGVMAIQIARFFGATVFTTVGSKEKAEAALSLGAEHVLLYRETDWVEEIRKITSKEGVDMVVDHVGGEIFAKSLRVLAKGGRLVTCGATAGAEVALNLRVLFFKGHSYLGSTMGNRGDMDDSLVSLP